MAVLLTAVRPLVAGEGGAQVDGPVGHGRPAQTEAELRVGVLVLGSGARGELAVLAAREEEGAQVAM